MLINTFEFKSDNPATKGSRAGVQCLEIATVLRFKPLTNPKCAGNTCLPL